MYCQLQRFRLSCHRRAFSNSHILVMIGATEKLAPAFKLAVAGRLMVGGSQTMKLFFRRQSMKLLLLPMWNEKEHQLNVLDSSNLGSLVV